MNRTAIFDAVRDMLRRGFTEAEVQQLDRAIDEALGKPLASPPNLSRSVMRVGRAGVELLHRFEGCARKLSDGRVQAYPDPGPTGLPWTIGWGSTGPGIERGTIWTQEQCDARFAADLVSYGNEVLAALRGAPVSQAQFDALVSFHYNTGAIGRATLTRKHVAGDYAGAAREFVRWNKAKGKVMAGLTRRREAEAALYRSGS